LNSVATWRRRRRKKVGMRAFVNKEFFNQSRWTTSKEVEEKFRVLLNLGARKSFCLLSK
jgi:hypothetical protein